MYCYSGGYIQDEAKCCPNCGAPSVNELLSENKKIKRHYNSFCMVGFVLSIVSLIIDLIGIISIMGLTFCVIGIVNSGKNNGKGKALCSFRSHS